MTSGTGFFSTRNALLAGVLLMLAGDFMFALNDALGKWLVATFTVGQVMLIRSIGAFIILGPLIARQGPANLLRVDRPLVQAFRAVLTAVETTLFYAAVVYLPLADVMSFYMAGPIYVAALSHVMLGEKVGWRRWIAILLGFVGVLVILRPGSAELSTGSLIAIAGSLAFALTIILGRMLRGTSDTTLVTWQTICALAIGVVMSLGNWTPAGAFDWGAMLLLGVVACIAHLLIVRALKLAPAATLAPLHYTLLLWAIVFGWLFFNDLPDAQTLVGAGLVVVAGLFIVHRQKVVADVPPEDVRESVS
ncbi:MAG: DMT family transporter [Rhizobiaceae bacterium]|nr:DMT family transporter [Rhizobiaceae bacterium]